MVHFDVVLLLMYANIHFAIYMCLLANDYVHVSCFPGSQTPNPVTSITVFSVSHVSILLQFVVTSLAFTPETYRMQYGLQPNNLDMTSLVTANLNDFDATNHQLIIGAAGLVDNTTYYYQIQATNTVGTTSSTVMSVTTLPARESCTHFVSWDVV